MDLEAAKAFKRDLDATAQVADTEITAAEDEDRVVGYKILKASGTQRQMEQLLEYADMLGLEIDELEDGMPQPMRELLTPDEVRMMDNRHAILFIRGERPVMDLKYDLRKHPDYPLTAEAGGGLYGGSRDVLSFAGLYAEPLTEEEKEKQEKKSEKPKGDFLIFTEDELEEELNKLDHKEEKK